MEMSVSESMKNMRTRREQQRVMWLIPAHVVKDVRHVAVENGVTTSQLVTKRDNYTCQVGGKTTGRLAVHHIIPRKDGGQDSIDNPVTVCDGV
jgi:hypothetical protein